MEHRTILALFCLILNLCIGQSDAATIRCGGSSYDANRFVCCAGFVPYLKSTGSACCGYKNYNPATSVCCDERSNPKYVGNSRAKCCCGVNNYDPDVSVCYNKRVVPRFPTPSNCAGGIPICQVWW